MFMVFLKVWIVMALAITTALYESMTARFASVTLLGVCALVAGHRLGRISPRGPGRVEVDAHGRAISLEVAEELDRYGQFRVRLVLDNKERYLCNFTDKSEDGNHA